MGGGPGYAAHVSRDLAEDLVGFVQKARASGWRGDDIEKILATATELKSYLDEVGAEWEVYYRIMSETVGTDEWKQLQLMVDSSNKQAARFHLITTLSAADKGYRSLDSFVSWFVAGVGASLGLIVANLDKISPYIQFGALKWALGLVVVALVLVGIAKFFGSIVCASAGGMERALSEIDAWRERGWDFPSDRALDHAREQGTPRWFRYYPKFLRTTDPSQITRQTYARLAVAGISSLIATVLVTAALVIITAGLTLGAAKSTATPSASKPPSTLPRARSGLPAEPGRTSQPAAPRTR